MRDFRQLYIVVMIILYIILAYLVIKFVPLFFPFFKIILFIITPFVLAAFISYLLYPLIDKLASIHINKALAIISIYVSFFCLLAFFIYKGFPILIAQLEELGEQLPKIITMYEDSTYALFENTAFLPEVFHDKMKLFIQQIEMTVENRLESLFHKITGVLDVLFILVIVPVLVFYFLIDYERMKCSLFKLLSNTSLIKTEKILTAIDKSLGSYLRGQITISSIVALITFLMYYTFELKYALLLAIIMGLMNVIPYFGPIIGSVPAILIALTTSWHLALIILITNIMIQIIENTFLSPYIMGKSVQIHPVFIIFLLMIGAELGGVIGMIIVIPLTTIIKAIYVEVFRSNSNAIDI